MDISNENLFYFISFFSSVFSGAMDLETRDKTGAAMLKQVHKTQVHIHGKKGAIQISYKNIQPVYKTYL